MRSLAWMRALTSPEPQKLCQNWMWVQEIGSLSLKRERKKDRRAVLPHIGMSRYTELPFCLNNAPPILQIAKVGILASFEWQKITMYLDDVTNVSNNDAKKSGQVEQLLRLMEEAWMKLKIIGVYSPFINSTFRSYIVPSNIRKNFSNEDTCQELSFSTDVLHMPFFSHHSNVYSVILLCFSPSSKTPKQRLTKC